MPCVLVVTPLSLLPCYARAHDPRAPLACAATAGALMHALATEEIAAVVCDIGPLADAEMLRILDGWYAARRGNAPLLAVVTDLVRQGNSEEGLARRATLRFSRYHSRPDEVVALVRQWALPVKKGKKPI